MSEEHETVEVVDDAQLEAVRQVVLAAYPDSVAELIRGTTVPELLASIEPARAAYARVSEAIAIQAEVAVAMVPVVPAGGGSALIDPGALPAAEKVRRGIADRSR